MSRRGLLRASLLGSGVLAGCSTAPGGSSFAPSPQLVPIRARTDRIFDIAVCLRPFRPAGPRIDTERLGDVAGRAQLRPWRQRLVALLGLQHPGCAPGHAGQSRRGGGDRLRDTGAHLGDPGAARRRAGDHLRPRAAAAHDVGPGDRRVDARFARGACQCCSAGLCGGVGGDGAHRLQDPSELSRPAGHAGRMDRPVFGCRRCAAERRRHPAAGPGLRRVRQEHRRPRAKMAAGAGRMRRRSRRGRSRAARP